MLNSAFSKMLSQQAAAEIADAARLANELQRDYPSMTRSAAITEAERIQAKYGIGWSLVSESVTVA